jgi:serine/threonine-protein kinase
LFNVCDALDAAHEKGIIHRDLKPENLFLVDRRGNRKQVKLLDFGIAKLTRGDGGNVQRTKADMVMGTPQYLSPEQARAKNVDHRTDIYSLGVIAYEMTLGRVPFEAESSIDIVVMHVNEPPPAPRSLWPEVPPPLEALLLRMLAKEAKARPSIAEIRRALRDLLPFSHQNGRPQATQALRSAGTPPKPPRAQTPGESEPAIAPTLPHGSATPSGTARPTPASPTGDIELDPADFEVESSPRQLIGGFAVVATIAIIAAVAFTKKTGNVASLPSAPNVEAQSPPVPSPQAPTPPASEVAPAEKEAELATLVVSTNVPDARIEVDGKMLADSVQNSRLSISPGEHSVVVSAPGHVSSKSTVLATRGGVVEIAATLKAAAAPVKAKHKASSKDKDYMIDPFAR